MGVFRVAAFAAMTSLAFIPSIAQAGTACWYPNEARAAQVRALQTMLMVGTLQCRRSYRASEELYTDFIMNQRRFLDANAEILKTRFSRENGPDAGQGAYDRFGTMLANQFSEQLGDREFCDTVHRFARLAANASSDELLELAEAVSEAPVSGTCRPSSYSYDGRALEDRRGDYDRRREPPPPPRVAISDGRIAEAAPVAAAMVAAATAAAEVQAAAAEPAVEPQPAAMAQAAAPALVSAKALVPGEAKVELIQQIAAAPAPAPVPVEAKVELVQQAKAEPAAAASGPDRAEALQAAIVALQSAVVALQAVSASQVGEPGPVTSVELPAGGTK